MFHCGGREEQSVTGKVVILASLLCVCSRKQVRVQPDVEQDLVGQLSCVHGAVILSSPVEPGFALPCTVQPRCALSLRDSCPCRKHGPCMIRVPCSLHVMNEVSRSFSDLTTCMMESAVGGATPYVSGVAEQHSVEHLSCMVQSQFPLRQDRASQCHALLDHCAGKMCPQLARQLSVLGGCSERHVRCTC